MEEQVSVNSWSDFLKLGEKYSLQRLKEKTVNFVFDNFTQVMNTPEFLRLPKDFVCYFLGNNLLKAQEEIDVFRAAKSWIEEDESRIGFLRCLMECVRFPMIPSDLLKDEVLGWHKLYKEPQCAGMVTEALCFHGEPFSQPLYKGKQFIARGIPGIAIVHSGFRESGFSVTNSWHDLFLFTSKFVNMGDHCAIPLAYQSITCISKGNFLFVTGTDSQYFGPVHLRYDVNCNKWLDLATPRITGLIGGTTVLCDQDIYLLGGILVDKSSDYKFDHDLNPDMHKYSIRDNRWSLVGCKFFEKRQNLDGFFGAFGASTVVEENVICLAGGYHPETGSVSSLRIHNVKRGVWFLGPDMHYKRSNLLLEACRTTSVLYAVGGLMLNPQGQVQRPVSLVEAYHSDSSQWTVLNTVINISSATSHLKDGVMYIIGGYRGCKNASEEVASDVIMKFDTKKDVIFTSTKDSYPLKCPIPCIHHGSAFITVPRK